MDRRIGFAGIILIVVVIVGCANTPVERQDKTAQSLADLRDSMKETRAQIDKTLASLNTLQRASEGQLREAYTPFAKDVDTMAKQAATLDKESSQMKRRSEAWLAAWKDTYGEVKNAELKELTDKRREQVLLNFYQIDGSLAAAREAFAPFIANLQDVKKVIGIDLTPQNVAAVSNTAVVQNANQNGAAAARALDVAITDLQALIDSLTPAPTR
jgi:chromosome segregation ATPase